MGMIRILLADDEPVILQGLRKLLPWQELGMEIVGEAYDGNELREMTAALSPDLIISDISMPGCTGIDIIKEIHESGKKIKVVFISAYQEFSYAQDAVKYGAVDYLVKPIDKEQLEQVMRKVIRLIGEATEGVRNKEIAVHFERKKRNETIEALLNRLTDGDKVAADMLQELGAVTNNGYVTVCLAELDNLLDGTNRWRDQERNLIDFAVTNVMVETVTQTGRGFYFRKGEAHGVLLQHDSLEEPLAFAEDIHQKINAFLKLSISIGVGISVERLKDADKSAQVAAEALDATYFAGKNRVIAHRNTKGDPEAKPKLAELQHKLIRALTSSSSDDSRQLMTEILKTNRTIAGDNKDSVVSSVYTTLAFLQQELKTFGIPTPATGAGDHDLLEQLNASQSFNQLQEKVMALFSEIRRLVEETLGNKELLQLIQVKNYIEEHYADNITLESISALVYMNPYYFSSFFKKHAGVNFKSYLTEIRMKHAHRLLLQTEMMVYEIADRVGYNNARHFSDMFKKMYGKLPMEYKQSVKGQ